VVVYGLELLGVVPMRPEIRRHVQEGSEPMLPRRKTSDPKLVKLMDEGREEQLRFDRLFRRMSRTFRACLKCNQRCNRLAKRAAERRAELDAEQGGDSGRN